MRRSSEVTPQRVAAEMDEFVSQEAADGFILIPPLGPGGLDGFVDEVVPILQERGVFRTRYTGSTLPEHLGLAEPARTFADHCVRPLPPPGNTLGVGIPAGERNLRGG